MSIALDLGTPTAFLDHLYSENLISIDYKNTFETFFVGIDDLNKIDEKIVLCQDMQNFVSQQSSFSCYDRNVLMSAFSIREYRYKYFKELIEASNDGIESFDGCGYVDFEACEDQYQRRGFIIGSLGLALLNNRENQNNGTNSNGGGGAFLVGALGGLVGSGTGWLFAQEFCKCRCDAPTNVNVRVDDCEFTGRFTGHGYGSDTDFLRWSTNNFNQSSTLAPTAWYFATQVSPSVPLPIIVRSVCEEQVSPHVFRRTFDLYKIGNDAKPIGVIGRSAVSTDDGQKYRYDAIGPAVADKDNYTFVMDMNGDGTVTAQGDLFIEIVWDVWKEDFEGSVTATAINICSGAQSSSTLDIRVVH